jgi:hypothetical protein
MGKTIYSWRYYSLGKERYHECMNTIFKDNLRSLYHTNAIVAAFAG